MSHNLSPLIKGLQQRFYGQGNFHRIESVELVPSLNNMRRLEIIIPLFCAFLNIFFLTPVGINSLSFKQILLVHILSYLSLGIFFEVPELSLNALCLFWARKEATFIPRKKLIAQFIRVRYILTHFVAP